MSELQPSIMICECLDGPYRGLIVRVGVRAEFVEVRDRFDESRRAEWYQVVTVDFGAKELRWARPSYATAPLHWADDPTRNGGKPPGAR